MYMRVRECVGICCVHVYMTVCICKIGAKVIYMNLLVN